MPNGRSEFEQLREAHQQNLRGFVEVELDLGFTFVELALTERDQNNLEHFQHAKHHAEKALAAIRKFVVEIQDPETRTKISQRCDQLAEAVAALQ